MKYLKNNPNPYNDYMVEKILKPTVPQINSEVIQKHHIIPLCKGGSHVDWNVILLTKKEHIHALRFQTYKEFEDAQTLRLFNIHIPGNSSNEPSSQHTLDDIHFQTEIKKILDSFSTEAPSTRKSLLNSSTELKNKKTIWAHPEINYKLIIYPNHIKESPDLKVFFIQHLPFHSKVKQHLFTISNKTFRTRLNNLLKAHNASMYGFELLSVVDN